MTMFFESEYEEALVGLLCQQGWAYALGKELHRAKSEPLILDDLTDYLRRRYPLLEQEEIREVIDRLRHVGGQTHFDRLRSTYRLIRDGFRYERHGRGEPQDIVFIDFEDPTTNIFRVVNQYEVSYGPQGSDIRIPDVLLFVNGIPLCIFELKNPTDAHATIADAYEQIHTRYRRDIPHLLRYCPLSCISDATTNNTRLGTTYTPYQHYYAWKKVHNEDPPAEKGVDQVRTIVAGVYEPSRFLEILRDYVYFPDAKYDAEEEIVCRYPQFFATRLLRDHVLQAYAEDSRRGGTYFGATGCGKTFTMMFLARQLSLRCPDLGSPTIVMIVDRDDLQSQAGKLFLRSEEFLSLGEARVIESRAELREEMGMRRSGGFFICTVQKFCEDTGVLNERRNIVCFSDEAHRTQVRLNGRLRISTGEGADDDGEIGAFVTKPYAELLRTAFPHATFVGFTGTPIDDTVQIFGDIVDSYTMQQSVADGITRDIKYIPRIAEVTLDSEKVREINAYYKQCAEEGATEEDVLASERAMSAMEVILGDSDRLRLLAEDIIRHYTQACDNKPDVVQKAMIVCSNRTIAYRLLQQFRVLREDWFVERKAPEGTVLEQEELDRLSPMPTIAMVATRGANDPKEMYDYLGDKRRIKALDEAFKAEHSNFRVVIVVDMWITGFDVPSLTYLYNDKPLKKHTLIQTISRVNRNYPGKEYGYVIDYIGIHKSMVEAIKQFGGDDFGPSVDDVQQSLEVVREELELTKQLFGGFDLTPFTDRTVSPIERLECLSGAAEHILTQVSVPGHLGDHRGKPQPVSPKTFFLSHVKHLRTAYDICQPSDVLSPDELALSQCFMAIASYLRKTSGEKHDTESMNRQVEQMVREALECKEVVGILETDTEEEIFSSDFIERLQHIKLPATRMEVLVKMLRKSIVEYKERNKIAAQKYEEMLRKTLEEYHTRREALSAEEATETQRETVEALISSATMQAYNILRELGAEKEDFRRLDLSFEEKAFYDILLYEMDRHNFEYGTVIREGDLVINETCWKLAKEIKEIVDIQSAYSDWLNSAAIRAELNRKIYFCLRTHGFPPEYGQEVRELVMSQVETLEGRRPA